MRTDEMQDRPEEVDLTAVIFDLSVSLDGFVKGLERSPEAAGGRRRTAARVGLRREGIESAVERAKAS